MNIGFLGGGSFGGSLAPLLAAAGHEVVVGLRDPRKAADGAPYRVASLEQAAEHGEAIIIAIPYLACADVLPALASRLAGKIVVDATNPLREDWSPLSFDDGVSAAETLRRLLPGVRLVKAFNTVFADAIRCAPLETSPQRPTVFVAGDDASANESIAGLAASAGFTPMIAGPLSHARYLEAMAHLNIQLAVVRGGGTNAGYFYRQGL